MIPTPTYQFKFVLVGDSSVGKSSILNRFVDDAFHDNLLATIGVDFKFRRMKLSPSPTPSSALPQDIKIQIWDTAGQQTFRSLVSAYYHSADAIIIVYDLTFKKSYESIVEYWIKQAENNNKNQACIFIVGNKVDQKKEVEEGLKKDIEGKHQISGWYQVSAKTGENIESAFGDICRVLIKKNKGKHNKDLEPVGQNKDYSGQKRLTRSQPNIKIDDAHNLIKKKKCQC